MADPVAVGKRLRTERERRGEDTASVAVALKISVFQLGEIERGAVKRPSAKMERAIEGLFLRYEVDGAPRIEMPTPAPAAPIVAAFNRVPEEIRDAVETLWQGQARLLAQFAETVWRRATDGATAKTPDRSPSASDAEIGRERLRRRKRA